MSKVEVKMYKILMVGLFDDVWEFDVDSCSSENQARSIAEIEFADYRVAHLLKDEVSPFTLYPEVKVKFHVNDAGKEYYEAWARGVFHFIFRGEFGSRKEAVETCTNAFNERFRVIHSDAPDDFHPFAEVNAIDETDSKN